MDLESRARWVDYSRAKDVMFAAHRHQELAVVGGRCRRQARARLNCIQHLLQSIPYEDLTSGKLELPERQELGYHRPPVDEQTFVTDHYADT